MTESSKPRRFIVDAYDADEDGDFVFASDYDQALARIKLLEEEVRLLKEKYEPKDAL